MLGFSELIPSSRQLNAENRERANAKMRHNAIKNTLIQQNADFLRAKKKKDGVKRKQWKQLQLNILCEYIRKDYEEQVLPQKSQEFY